MLFSIAAVAACVLCIIFVLLTDARPVSKVISGIVLVAGIYLQFLGGSTNAWVIGLVINVIHAIVVSLYLKLNL